MTAAINKLFYDANQAGIKFEGTMCVFVCVCVCFWLFVVAADTGLMITNWRQTAIKNRARSDAVKLLMAALMMPPPFMTDTFTHTTHTHIHTHTHAHRDIDWYGQV